MSTTLSGQLERITFASEDTGFSVCKVKVKGERNPVTAVGHLPSPTPGEYLIMEGQWTRHPKFGAQFQIESCRSVAPATRAGMIKYLGSGLIKGIGPVMAKRIVEKFGDKSLDMIDQDIKRLTDIEGIGAKRVGMIQNAWAEQKEIREVMVFLQSHGVSPGFAAKIFKHYGQDSIHIVKENPYQLAEDIYGIGFLSADKIAQHLGIPATSGMRVGAGVLYVLHQLSDDGHVCYPFDELTDKIHDVLDVPGPLIQNAILAAKKENKITIETTDSGKQLVFLSKFYFCENEIAIRLNTLKAFERTDIEINSEKAVEWIKGELPIELAEKQVEALHMATSEKVLVITGGPGTGKTTLINSVIKIYKKKNARILLAAPTGRAAKRMSEATRHHALTIHRLLEYSMGEQGFKKNRENPLNCDLLVIDEASMIDTVLMHHLLKAVPDQAVFIMVGDVNQLPSVGAGNVLNDIICSAQFPVVRLDTIFRQAKRSLIVVNAHRIHEGKFPYIANQKKNSNFFFIQKEEPEEVLSTVLDLVQNRVPERFGYDPVDDIQVLTPMHRGVVGAGNLNHELQQILNQSNEKVTRGPREFRKSDKVMQIRNNYDKGTFNGDIGRIERIDPVDQVIGIRFDHRDVEYDFSQMDEIVHAYAVSVHKSQGSEYPAVIIPVVTQHYMLLQRNLIYTAITRGKRLVILVGTKKALAIAINTVKAMERHTRLCERLQ